MIVRKKIIIILLILIVKPAFASLLEVDTLKSYRLGEVISRADKTKKNLMPAVINEIQYNEIHRSDATSIAGLGSYIPAAFIQTNSRGETLLFLRGAGERQLGLFFDGVLFNVPWDNRMDLSLVPIDIVGKMQINKGSSSILFGPNILGGAVNISSVERSSQGIGAIARLQYNDAGSQLLSLTNDGRFGNFNYLVNYTYLKSSGFLLSEDDIDARLDNQRSDSRLRTNSDQDRYSLYARAEYNLSEGTTLGLSLNHINAEKGVAPLTEYSSSELRYWRYPEWKRTIATINGEHIFSFDKDLKLRATLWFDKFAQTIDSYESLDYKNIIEIQKDDDRTVGGRFSLSYDFNKYHSLILALNAYNTKHNEDISNEEISVFTQNTFSSGLEYKGSFDNLFISGGFTFDRNSTPETGIFIDANGNTDSDYGAFIGVRYYVSDEISLFTNVSRRTRFPTLREAFSGALNKFKVNTELQPETGIINELGMSVEMNYWQFEFAGFASFYDDLIQKIRLTKEQDILQRKMRVNFSKATIAGIEASFRYNPLNSFSAEGHITYMYSDGGLEWERIGNLEYKPEFLTFLLLKYKLSFGLMPQAEIEYTGRQYGEAPDGEMRSIDQTVKLNLRIAYQFSYPENTLSEVYLRGNNIFDAASLSRIGLPNAGRMFYTGVVVRL